MQKTRYSFDKNVSSQLKAFALILMIMHHLWHRRYFALFEPISYGHLLLSIGMLGKICVGMFLFVSGYGLMASYSSAGNVFHICRRLKKVLLPFWLIVILVAPFLLVIHEVKWYQVVTDALLLTRNMNRHWWFMQTYVIYVVCFPLFAKSLKYQMVWIPLLMASVVCFQPLAKFVRYYSEAGHHVLHYFPLLYSGMIAHNFSLFDFLAKQRLWCRLLLVVALVVARFATGWNILNIGLIVAMVMFLIDIQGFLSDSVKRGFDFLGKMSMNMWLIHLFFIVYGFHFRNAFVDLVWIYLVSLVAACVIWRVYHKLCGYKW